jgi:hypothetical protein
MVGAGWQLDLTENNKSPTRPFMLAVGNEPTGT